jgi:iron(III) transport system permease protein
MGRGSIVPASGPTPVGSTLLVWGFVALLAAGLLYPVTLSVGRGFVDEGRPSLYWIKYVLTSPELLKYMGNSLLLAATATLLSIVMALPLAVLRATRRFLGSGVLGVAVLVPLILPPFVGAMSMRRLLSENGVLNALLMQWGWLDPSTRNPDWLVSGGFFAVAMVQALHLFPILYLNVSAAMANIDPAYRQAARDLGASRGRTFWSVTLPLLRPGLFAGGTIVFIWSLTDVGTPLMVGVDNLLAVRIFKLLEVGSLGGKTYAMVTVLLAGSIGLYVLGKFLLGRPIRTESAKASVAEEVRTLGPAGTGLTWLLFGSVVVLAILPHLGVIVWALSGDWINSVLPTTWTGSHMKEVLDRPESYNSIINSLRYAGVSTAIDLLAGGVIAYLLVRTRARGRTVLDAFAMLPLAVPGMILAAGYLALTAPGKSLAAIGPDGNPFLILVIAYAVRRLPFVVRGVSAGLEQIPVSLEEAARNLGATRGRTLWRVTLPLLSASLIAAGVLTFSFAMLEVSDSLLLAQDRMDYPITKEIYKLATAGTPDALNRAAAMGVYAMGLLAGTMAVATVLLGKKLGAIFRA